MFFIRGTVLKNRLLKGTMQCIINLSSFGRLSILKTVSFNFDGKKTICMQFDETMELP